MAATHGAVTLATDRSTALIELESASGLLQRQGRRARTRTLEKGEIAAVRLRPDGAIQIAFADFGWLRGLVRAKPRN
ncbi:MAG TPA: hypothetical protein VKP66_00430 [Steroidobacteraceae bacterium]|nr:hypothetical protein [Steroidobacteraceae bacterium]